MAVNYIFPKSPDPLLKTDIDTATVRIGHLNNLVDQVNSSDQVNFYCNRDIPESFMSSSPTPVVRKKSNVDGFHSLIVDSYRSFSIYNGFQSNDFFIFGDDSNIVSLQLSNSQNSITGIQLNYSNSILDLNRIRPEFNLRGIDLINVDVLYAGSIYVEDYRSGVTNRPILNFPNLINTRNQISLANIAEFNCPKLEEIVLSDTFRLQNGYYSSTLNFPSLKKIWRISLLGVSEGELFSVNLPSLEYITNFEARYSSKISSINFTSTPFTLKGMFSTSDNYSQFEFDNLSNISAASLDNLIIQLNYMFGFPQGHIPNSFSLTINNCNSYSPSVQAREVLDALVTYPGITINVQGY